MRIALFSDVHANLPALDACLAAIDEQRPDVVYCLGDLVGYNIWPNEVINKMRQRSIPAIAGNYDHGVGLNSNDCGCAYKTELEKEMGAISISFTNAIINKEERAYLRTLPAHIRIEFKLTSEPLNLLLVHGSPRRNNEYLFEDREEKSMIRIMTEANANIMCFGHTHKPFHRILNNGGQYLHAINTGSAGKPKDGNPQGCFVMLKINENGQSGDNDAIEVDFIRFDYDIERAAKAIEGSVLPNQYADMLRNGQ